MNDYANATTPLVTNVIIAHPDATPNHPGTMELARVLYRDDDALFSVFADGTVTSLDLASQKHTTLGSLFQKVAFVGAAKMTYAHVMDGSIIKSFILDSQGNSYLVKMDTSVSPPTISAPLKINYIKGMTLVTPIAAHMMNTNGTLRWRYVVTFVFGNVSLCPVFVLRGRRTPKPTSQKRFSKK